ncbi:site-specific integrase [Opitutus sp. ER46]|uniref:tyrosine-type recombinase/integrase n=1 Tax=Opitutus sp. ER46 TaxID=2161864 RepID=UPI000D2FDA74|nr:site-specific integrase [Opitutus sp. ER46]PTX92334.1 hypothetical protein DB354_13405 [Opitutus sp. ER46]
MLAHVYRPRRRKDGKVETARLYRGRYRLKGDFAITEVPLHTPDKRVAERMLAEIIAEREREKAGLIAPKTEREAANRSLDDHLKEFVADLGARGRVTRYTSMLASRFTRLATECQWKLPSDVTPQSFVAWRSQNKTLSRKTLNDFLATANGFLTWMTRQGNIARNPLADVARVDVRGHQQQRRAFSEAELERLFAVATPDIRTLYMAAAFTGLRIGELQKVVWADIHFDHERPYIAVRASTTKNRKAAILPMHPALVEKLQAVRPDNPLPETKVFLQHSHMDRRIRKDMAKAGIARLDSLGRKLDFHALRYTFATRLAAGGASQRVTQELMRHSDPRLTANIYTDVTQLPLWDAVNGLKWTSRSGSTKVPADSQGRCEARTDTAIDPQNGVSGGQIQAFSGAGKSEAELPASPHPERFEHVLAQFAKGRQKLGATGFEGAAESPAEPVFERNSATATAANTAIDPQFLSTLGPVIAKLVARWASLPEGSRKAIEALLG